MFHLRAHMATLEKIIQLWNDIYLYDTVARDNLICYFCDQVGKQIMELEPALEDYMDEEEVVSEKHLSKDATSSVLHPLHADMIMQPVREAASKLETELQTAAARLARSVQERKQLHKILAEAKALRNGKRSKDEAPVTTAAASETQPSA